MTKVTVPSYISFSLMALQHSISIADAKAGYILAGSIAFLTFSLKEALTEKTITSPVVLVTIAGFITSAALAAETFRPRLTAAPERSLSYWKSKIYTGKPRRSFRRSLTKISLTEWTNWPPGICTRWPLSAELNIEL